MDMSNTVLIASCLCIVFTFASSDTPEALQDLVTDLPGESSVSFRHFAGYVPINKSNGRAMFYWFFESMAHPRQKPLVLWLNGGPGCSSVGYGATQEIGPFLVDNKGNSINFNPHAWNREANILFPESPVGVGFSYSIIRLVTIKNLGMILQLGNPETSDAEDWKGYVDYAWNHAGISDETYGIISRSCNFSSNATWDVKECKDGVDEVIKHYDEIDQYSLYTPSCIQNSTVNSILDSRRFKTNLANSKMMPRMMGGFDPCLDDYKRVFYNRVDVQKALHASDGVHLKKWSTCNDDIFHNWTNSILSVLPIYKKLIAGGLRIWVYSGDTDGRVPVLGIRYCINKLELPIKTAWRPWYHEKQVSGWFQESEGLMCAKFKGAGHDVPSFKPGESLAFFTAFLNLVPPPLLR